MRRLLAALAAVAAMAGPAQASSALKLPVDIDAAIDLNELVTQLWQAVNWVIAKFSDRTGTVAELASQLNVLAGILPICW